jgi:uncharacterized protein (DUF885 family)
MKNIIKGIFAIVFLSSLVACEEDKKDQQLSSEEIAKSSKELNDYFEVEFEKDLAESPMMQTRLGRKTAYGKWDDFSSQKYKDDLEKARKRLDFVKTKVDEFALDNSTRLSYRLYKQRLKDEIADYDFRFYDYPINQMHGYHAELPAFLINMHRIDSIADAEAYIERLNGMPKVMEQIVEGLRIREQNGILAPQFVFEKVIEDSRNVIKGKPFTNSTEASTLLEDFKTKVKKLNLPTSTQLALVNKAENALNTSVRTAYENLITTLEDQQQRATTEHGAWKFPKGEAYYNNRLNRITTTSLKANEIHEIGLSEVARIHREMEEIMKKTGFTGSLQDFFEFMRTDKQFYYPNTPEGKKRYLAEATGLINDMKAKLDDLFITKPKADIVVKAVEAFREKSAGKAFYQAPAIDGSRPGTYYANLYDMKAMPTYQMEALAFHEGIPGHHMQIAIAQELDSIPMFRKFSFYTAYVEGWGLYSELVPKEIGFYTDPYSDFGRLAMELWRSCRLVVDTGIHAKKWTREEGIAYYKENTPNAESDCVKMVERHIVMPGQATAYKIGMNKIVELREEAKDQLGEDFDIREFHDVVLTNGAVPLNILEEMVQEWVQSKKA